MAVAKLPAETVRVSPSTSLSTPLPLSASTLPFTALSSSVTKASSAATGESFTPSMVMVAVAVSVPPLPSLIV